MFLILSDHYFSCPLLTLQHVIQRCVECVAPGKLQFIVDAFQGQVRRQLRQGEPFIGGENTLERRTLFTRSKTLFKRISLLMLEKQVLSLAMHPYGCRVIQRTMTHCNEQQVEPIMAELMDGTMDLVKDQA